MEKRIEKTPGEKDMTQLEKSRVVRKKELLATIGLSDATVWRMERDGFFPKRIRLGGNSCGWLESEVLSWLSQRPRAGNNRELSHETK
jgi:prophage regulatory protein